MLITGGGENSHENQAQNLHHGAELPAIDRPALIGKISRSISLSIRLREYSSGGILSVWTIRFCEEFITEFDALSESTQDRMLGYLRLLQSSGPELGRPYVDTLNGSRHSNMKELRITERAAVWRIAFAFDPNRHAVLLVAGDKGGLKEQRFYQGLIRRADARFDKYLSKGESDVQDT